MLTFEWGIASVTRADARVTRCHMSNIAPHKLFYVLIRVILIIKLQIRWLPVKLSQSPFTHSLLIFTCEIPCKLVLPSHKISTGEDVLTPHFHRLPHTCNGKTVFFRYRSNLLHQQVIVAVHSYAYYNDTHMRREKRRSPLKWVVQVQPDLTVICHAHESHHRLFSRTHEHLLHSYVGPYDTPILVRMSRSEVPTACYQAEARNVFLCIYRL